MKIIKISAVWCGACILNNKIWNNVKKDYPSLDIEELDLEMDELDFEDIETSGKRVLLDENGVNIYEKSSKEKT